MPQTAKDIVTDIITPDGRLLIKEVEVEKKSAGGVILSANTADPENTCKYGEIIYNGIKAENGHLNKLYQEGNKVYFGKFSGASVHHNGEKYLSLLESEIAAIAYE